MERLRVVIPCPGLGIAPRGFERFARDAWAALRRFDDMEVTLVKGRGPTHPRDITVPTLSRESAVSRRYAALTGRHVFRPEQMSFAVAIQPVLLRLRPHVVLLSEWHLAGALAGLRRALGRRFRIVLCNGAGGGPPFPAGVDHVQHPVPSLFGRAMAAGQSPARHTLLPLGVTLPDAWRPEDQGERARLRRRLGLPVDRPILLSVGALNAAEKRMDYVVREAAAARPRPFVALIGSREAESPWIEKLAVEHLGPDGFVARTVAPEAVADYYRSADVFVLASGSEAFGLTLAEALGHGLPVLAHDFDVPRFVLGEHGYFGDFRHAGALTRQLAALTPDDAAAVRGAERHRAVHGRFSWQRLAPDYRAMLFDVASSGTSAGC